MKSSRKFPYAKSRSACGFTLVEILVAIAVLGVLVLILAQIFGTMNNVWLYGQGKVNNFTKGRAMLNLMENDLYAAVFRPDLAAFPTVNGIVQCEFYTLRPGVPVESGTGTLRNISLVQYALLTSTTSTPPTSTLERTDMPVTWGDASTYLAFGNTAGFVSTASVATTGTHTPRDTAPGVVAFQVIFVQTNGSFSTTTFTPEFSAAGVANSNPTRGIGVTVAVIDDQSMKLLSTPQVTSLQTGFAGAVTSTRNVKADWENYLNTGIIWSNYPKSLGTGIGIFECYVPIP
jgi:prepilin-type N-terminal cleavage/methylation domain-containing protein